MDTDKVRGQDGCRDFCNMPELTVVEARQRLSYKIFESLVVIGVFILIFLFSLDTKIGVYNLDAARYLNDTPGYVQASSYPLSAPAFWVGQRPFTVPLFYKMIGYILQNYTDQGEMEQVGRIQLLISVLAWMLLALSVCFLLKKWMLRFLAFVVVFDGWGKSIYFYVGPLDALGFSLDLHVCFISCLHHFRCLPLGDKINAGNLAASSPRLLFHCNYRTFQFRSRPECLVLIITGCTYALWLVVSIGSHP